MQVCAASTPHQWLIIKGDGVKQAPPKAKINEKMGSSKLCIGAKYKGVTSHEHTQMGMSGPRVVLACFQHHC